MTRKRKWLFKQLNAILTPPAKYSLILIKCFLSFWYVIPLLLLGAILVVLWLFWLFDDEKHRKKLVLVCPIGCYRSKCSPDGGIQWLLVKPWSSSIRRCARYRTAALGWPSNHQLCWCICWLLFICLLPWWMLGRYGASSRPMPASSGFWSSPGHAALGDAVWIAPVHCRGHRNGRRTRCIRSSSSILSSTITVAKDHVMVN